MLLDLFGEVNVYLSNRSNVDRMGYIHHLQTVYSWFEFSFPSLSLVSVGKWKKILSVQLSDDSGNERCKFHGH